MLTPDQLSTLLARSAGGEGVRSVLAEWGCDNDDTLEWLKQHTVALRAAKREYQQFVRLESERVVADFKAMAANVEALPSAD